MKVVYMILGSFMCMLFIYCVVVVHIYCIYDIRELYAYIVFIIYIACLYCIYDKCCMQILYI